ncbi:MAG: helix-turn-helix domain-containing protein [Candidatus Gracilibacteria bacterium]|jgi:sugar-specific transcriptional regulator TrmB
MQETLIKIMTNLGLTDKESKVYLSCLEKGTSIVSEIAKIAKINRVTTYDILEKLKQKGLVSYYIKSKIKYFTATPPDVVLTEFEKRTNDLRVSLPKLKQLCGETAHPRIRYFEGIEGIKAIYADTLTAKTEILNYSNSQEIRKNWPTYDKDYVEQRAKKQIYLRGLSPRDRAGEIVKSEDEKYHRQMRLIPPTEFDFSNEINIYDDKVAIISFKDELIGMIIESVEIANSQRTIFNMCWSYASEHFEPKAMDIKTKMLNPITEEEIKRNHASLQTKKDQNVKTEKDNLSLF